MDDFLKLEHITYRERGIALDDISFSAARGENIAIFGPEDSGVNLICPIIAGLIPEFSGEVYFNNQSIKSFDEPELNRYRMELGYIQDEYGLLSNMTVEENIALPLRYHSTLSSREISELVHALIAQFNLGHCRNSRPDVLLNSERLKTAYARAIALDPGLVLIEHALERQCHINVQTFLNSVRRLTALRSKSFIFITYEPELYVDYCDRFIMIVGGRIVFSGSRQEFTSCQNGYVCQFLQSLPDGPMKFL